MTPTPELIEAAARTDADFDGRPFDRLSRADRERYLARAERSLSAVLPMIEREAVERCAKVARDTFDGEKALRVNCEIGSIDRNLHNWGMNVAMDIEVAIRALAPKEASDG